jgi:hypothetical protein
MPTAMSVICVPDLAGTVRDDNGSAGRLGHFDRGQGLGQRADLVCPDRDGVGDVLPDAFLPDLRVGHEQVVTQQTTATRCRLLRP